MTAPDQLITYVDTDVQFPVTVAVGPVLTSGRIYVQISAPGVMNVYLARRDTVDGLLRALQDLIGAAVGVHGVRRDPQTNATQAADNRIRVQ